MGHTVFIIVSKGGESSVKIHCPYSFLGMYGYIHTSSDGTVTCDVENSSWDMCADNTQMTFSYSQCSTKVAYSGKYEQLSNANMYLASNQSWENLTDIETLF